MYSLQLTKNVGYISKVWVEEIVSKEFWDRRWPDPAGALQVWKYASLSFIEHLELCLRCLL